MYEIAVYCQLNYSVIVSQCVNGQFLVFFLQVFTLYIWLPVHKFLTSWDFCLFDSILCCIFFVYYCDVVTVMNQTNKLLLLNCCSYNQPRNDGSPS